MLTQLPLLGRTTSDTPLLHHGDQQITRGEFIAQAQLLATNLPAAPYVINLCQNRYHFMLGFAAACLRQQTNLLPASQASGALNILTSDYSQHYIIDDEYIQAQLQSLQNTTVVWPTVPSEHIAAITFTSGSTGKPQGHPSTWGTLVASAQRSAARIFLQRGLNMVATVPPQHMFGLETTILQPLFNDCVIHSDKPFFPADIFSALESMPQPRVLISTPAHLKACITAKSKMPAIDFVLSATAPLARELATEIELVWDTQVFEIYGSTETGAIASRRTVDGDTWELLPGGTLVTDEHSIQYQPQHATQTLTLSDQLTQIDATHFVLSGRSSDLIKVAGKRTSLSELNKHLLAIPGVIDGAIFQPATDQRVAALVVVDNVTERAIQAALAVHIDAVFLPRPLRIVQTLPRDAMGKLPHASLIAALVQARD